MNISSNAASLSPSFTPSLTHLLGCYFKRTALAVFVGMVLTSCTFIGAAYQNATTLIMFEVDSYLDLNEDQTQAGKLRTDALMAWHKREVLPLYVKQLRSVAGRIEQGFDAAQVTTIFDWGLVELRRINQYAAPQQAELLTSLNEKQVAYLQKKQAKDNVKFRKEWLNASKEDVLELRFDKFLTWAERIYGNLSSEQKKQLHSLSDATNFKPQVAYDEALARQAGVVRLIKNLPKNDALVAQAQITTFIASLENPSEYGAASRRELMQLIAATSQIATPAQRTAAKATLLDYANTFEGLSRGR
jgi:hypothetical protein